MKTLSTPITPAAVLRHCDASPRAAKIRETGFTPSAVWSKCPWQVHEAARVASLQAPGLGGANEVEALERLREVFTWRLTEEGYDALARAKEVLEESVLRTLERLESDGRLAVSVSAYNADCDCLTIYWEGQPVAWL